jgi:hypothetical protein
MENKKSKFNAILLAVLIFAIGIPVFASYIVPIGGVSTLSIQSGAVTQAKLAPRATSYPSPSPSVSQSPGVPPGGYAISPAGTVSTSTFPIAIPSNSVTITTTGRPIVVGLMCDSGSSECSIEASNPNYNIGGANFPIVGSGDLFLLRGSTTISRQAFVGAAPPSSFFYIDLEPSGTYTYTDEIAVGSSWGSSTGSITASASNIKIYAYEQ